MHFQTFLSKKCRGPATALQQLQQGDEERRQHDSNQGQEDDVVVPAHSNIMLLDSIYHQRLKKKAEVLGNAMHKKRRKTKQIK